MTPLAMLWIIAVSAFVAAVATAWRAEGVRKARALDAANDERS